MEECFHPSGLNRLMLSFVPDLFGISLYNSEIDKKQVWNILLINDRVIR